MEMNIGQIESRVRTTDAQSLLSEPLLSQIARAVAEWLRAEDERTKRGEQDRRLRSGVFGERDDDA
jgi:hypothetical protein